MNQAATTFIAFLQTAQPPNEGFGEDLLLLAMGIGLIILVFVLRRAGQSKRGGKKEPKQFADLKK